MLERLQKIIARATASSRQTLRFVGRGFNRDTNKPSHFSYSRCLVREVFVFLNPAA